MGRRLRPLDPAGGAAAQFAAELRTLRALAGEPPFWKMARRCQVSKSALAAAVDGRSLPSENVLREFVAVCRGDWPWWRERLYRAREDQLLETRHEPEDLVPGLLTRGNGPSAELVPLRRYLPAPWAPAGALQRIGRADLVSPSSTSGFRRPGIGLSRRRLLTAGFGVTVAAAGGAWLALDSPRSTTTSHNRPLTRTNTAGSAMPSGTPTTSRTPGMTAGADYLLYAASDVGLNAVDLATGKRRWQKVFGLLPTVLIVNGLLIVKGFEAKGSFGLYALSPLDGSVVWQKDARNMADTFISGGEVIVYQEYERNSGYTVNARSAHTGAPMWRHQGQGSIFGKMAADDRHVYFADSDGVHALDLASGIPNWVCRKAASAMDTVLTGGGLYANSQTTDVYAIDTNTGSVRWHSACFPQPVGGPMTAWPPPHFTTANGLFLVAESDAVLAYTDRCASPVWSYRLSASSSTPNNLIVCGDLVFLTGVNTTTLAAVDIHTGKARWTAPVSNVFNSTPVYVDGQVFIADSSGIRGFDIDTGTPTFRYTDGGSYQGTPVIMDYGQHRSPSS